MAIEIGRVVAPSIPIDPAATARLVTANFLPDAVVVERHGDTAPVI